MVRKPKAGDTIKAPNGRARVTRIGGDGRIYFRYIIKGRLSSNELNIGGPEAEVTE